MACTTIKLPTRNRVTSNRWTAYCQALHVHRLLHAQPGIDIPEKKHSEKQARMRKEYRSRKKMLIEQEKQAEINRQNQLLLKKILELQHRKPTMTQKSNTVFKERSGTKTNKRKKIQFNSGDVMRANRAVVRALQEKLESQRLAQENDRLVKRIINVRATIDRKKMIKDEKKRSRLVRNMTLNSNNRVLDLGHLTLHAVSSGKSADLKKLMTPIRPNLHDTNQGVKRCNRDKTLKHKKLTQKDEEKEKEHETNLKDRNQDKNTTPDDTLVRPKYLKASDSAERQLRVSFTTKNKESGRIKQITKTRSEENYGNFISKKKDTEKESDKKPLSNFDFLSQEDRKYEDKKSQLPAISRHSEGKKRHEIAPTR